MFNLSKQWRHERSNEIQDKLSLIFNKIKNVVLVATCYPYLERMFSVSFVYFNTRLSTFHYTSTFV